MHDPAGLVLVATTTLGSAPVEVSAVVIVDKPASEAAAASAAAAAAAAALACCFAFRALAFGFKGTNAAFSCAKA